MALITKAGIATILGIVETDIADSVYAWSKKQFFAMTDLREIEIQKTVRKLYRTSSVYFKLPHSNIKSIDTITKDGNSETFTLHTDLKFNPDTGLVWYSGGFGGGQLCEIVYTINAYTYSEVHDYLLSLLVSKALTLFTPDKVQQIKEVKIGNYTKKFGSAASSLGQYQEVLEAEIGRVVDLIQGNNGKLTLEMVL